MTTLSNTQQTDQENFQPISSSIVQIMHKDQKLAIIMKRSFKPQGIHFLTSPNLSQQLAYMSYPASKIIKPHIHNQVQRQVFYTQEVLFLRKGKLRVDFYTEQQQYLESYILEEGDVILLIQGGHGFKVLEEIEMIEVKQGPYLGDQDKTCFTPLDETQTIIVGEKS